MKNSYTYIVEQEQMIGQRSNQEDAILCSGEQVYEKKGFLAVLSDGMGGLSDGEKFSALATKAMVDSFETTEPMEDMQQELLNCFGEAQKRALALRGEGSQGGATVVAVLVRNYRCSFLSVGDSSICLLRKGGLIHLNREQKLGIALDESAAFGYLDEEFAQNNTRRNSLTCHFGSEEEIHCDLCSEPFIVMPGDRIALMSDGVTGVLSDEELVRALKRGSCRQAVRQVMEDVQKKKNPRQDNASILLVGFEKIKRSTFAEA